MQMMQAVLEKKDLEQKMALENKTRDRLLESEKRDSKTDKKVVEQKRH
jgi:hypothetical protein